MNILIFGGTTEGRELAERLAAVFSETGRTESEIQESEIQESGIQESGMQEPGIQRSGIQKLGITEDGMQESISSAVKSSAEKHCEQNIAEWKEGLLTVSVATELGAEELWKIEGIRILIGRMDIPAMKRALCGYDFCIDATHPYAVEATKNIRTACVETGVQYRRLLRELAAEADDPEMVHVRSAEEAAAFLASRDGRILLTTGAKEVGAFSGIARERLYVRILPMTESLMAVERAGVPHRNVVAMYGPFSQEMNEAIMRQFGIDWLVTKEAGEAGGFPEKIAAARAAGVRTVVIRRPVECGLSMEEILREVRSLYCNIS